MRQIKPEVFHRESMESSDVMPASTGVGDIQINSILPILFNKSRQRSIVLVDYGCGYGRLISELVTFDSRLLAKITYIGLDFDITAVSEAAKSYGLGEKCKDVRFFTFNQFFQSPLKADFVIAINVLHEIPLKDLATQIYDTTRILKKNGTLIIHDMEMLPSGERDFITWDGSEIVDLFTQCFGGEHEILLRKHKSKSSVPLFTVTVQFKKSFEGNLLVIRNACLKSFERKRSLVQRQFQELQNKSSASPISEADVSLHTYLSILVSNINNQIDEAKRGAMAAFTSVDSIPLPSMQEIIRISDVVMGFDYGRTRTEFFYGFERMNDLANSGDNERSLEGTMLIISYDSESDDGETIALYVDLVKNSWRYKNQGVSLDSSKGRASTAHENKPINMREYAFMTTGSLVEPYRLFISPIVDDKKIAANTKLGILMCGTPPEYIGPDEETRWTVFVTARWLESLIRQQQQNLPTSGSVPPDEIYGIIPEWPDQFHDFQRALAIVRVEFVWKRHKDGYLVFAQAR